ncbi:MAG: GTP-binding protein [Promethearchaeota archaeon]
MEKLLNELLENLMNAMKNVEIIAIVDKDGLMITSLMKSEDDNLVVGSVTATFDSFIDKVKKEFSGENFMNIMELGDKKFYFAAAGDNAILTIIGNKNINDRELKTYGEFAVKKIKSIFNNEPDISLSIPPILKTLVKFKDGKLPEGSFNIKIIVCGDFQVGKTSLIRRFVDNKFIEQYINTLGVDITKKVVKLSEQTEVSFLIWDIGGQIKHMLPYKKRFYNGANVAFIVCDKTRKKTLENVKMWLEDIRKELKREIPVLLIANKNDLKNQFEITQDDIKSVAEQLGLEYIETSAKSGENVEDAFKYLAYKALE